MYLSFWVAFEVSGLLSALSYMAPELRAPGGTAAAATQKGDVFAFGVVLLEAETGRQPTEGEGGLELEAWVRRAFKEERPLSEVVDPTLLVTDMLIIFLAAVVVETHLNAMVHHRNRPKTMVVVKFCTMLCALSDDHEPDDRAVHRAAQGWLVAKHLSVTAAAAIILLTARITMDFHCGTLSLCGC